LQKGDSFLSREESKDIQQDLKGFKDFFDPDLPDLYENHTLLNPPGPQIKKHGENPD